MVRAVSGPRLLRSGAFAGGAAVSGDDRLDPELHRLSVRTVNTLCREGLTTVSRLQATSDADLLKIRNLGQQTVDEIRAIAPFGRRGQLAVDAQHALSVLDGAVMGLVDRVVPERVLAVLLEHAKFDRVKTGRRCQGCEFYVRDGAEANAYEAHVARAITEDLWSES